MITITSPHNPRIKDLLKLAKSNERDRRRLTVVEGERECSRALAAGIIPQEAFVCPELLSPLGRQLLADLTRLDAQRRSWLAEIPAHLFAKLAYREDSGGLILIIPYLVADLAAYTPPSPAFIAIIEGIEKPGNLGAILRTADAAGLQGLIVTAGATDTHNPNVIRASLGARFTVPVFESSTPDTLAWLRRHAIQIIAAAPDGLQRYTSGNYTGPTAIVLGSEAHGLSPTWRAAADALVTIPMVGTVDSLNLATSTALLLYEVVRQRAMTTDHPTINHA
jgi:TrmH family RNA methyltransferase